MLGVSLPVPLPTRFVSLRIVQGYEVRREDARRTDCQSVLPTGVRFSSCGLPYRPRPMPLNPLILGTEAPIPPKPPVFVVGGA